MKNRRGFTLLEVLLATALVGLLLAGLNIFIFSMGELWGKNSDRRLFDQHVNAVTRYLQRELRAAGLPPAGKKGEYAITPQEIRPGGGLAETLLTFDLPGGSRLFEHIGHALPVRSTVIDHGNFFELQCVSGIGGQACAQRQVVGDDTEGGFVARLGQAGVGGRARHHRNPAVVVYLGCRNGGT